MECWFVVGVVVLLEALGLAWSGPGPRRGRHRPGEARGAGGACGAMRSWPGPVASGDPDHDDWIRGPGERG